MRFLVLLEALLQYLRKHKMRDFDPQELCSLNPYIFSILLQKLCETVESFMIAVIFQYFMYVYSQ